MSTSSSSPASSVNANHDDAVNNWWEYGTAPLAKRCIRKYGWSEEFTARVLVGYRKFLNLKRDLNDWEHKILSPSIPVDRMWHMHILDVANYIKDCELLCGRLVGHNPDGMLDAEARLRRVDTTKHILRNQLGGDLDEEVWNFGAISGTDGGGGSVDESPDRKRRRENECGAGNEQKQQVVEDGLTIRIKDGNGEETQFKIKQTTKMGKVFQAYSKFKGISLSTLAFRLDGERVGESNIARKLELEDGDMIDAILEQVGC